jgi:PhoH-like ATPase
MPLGRNSSPTPRPVDGRGSGSDSRLTVVLDTNVLLSDPEALYAFPGVDLVIVLTVIEELDGKKTRLDDIGYAARSTVRTLEQLRTANGGNLQEPVDLPNGATVRICINGLRLDTLAEYHLPADKADNRIIAAALGLVGEGYRVRLVSMDGSMRVKAAHLGLEAEDYVRDADRRETAGTGWHTLDVPSELIEMLYSRRRGGVDVDSLDPVVAASVADVLVNEFAVLRAGNQSVLVRRRAGTGGDVLVELSQMPSEASGLRPKSKEQQYAMNLLLDPTVPVVALDGQAGTGKTILTLAAALQLALASDATQYDRLMILRPMVSVGGRDTVGFLPGTLEEKLGPWFETIIDTMVALGRSPNYESARKQVAAWQQKEKIVLDSVTHLRGRSLHRHLIVVDEAQNLSPSVLKTILTRAGQGSKVVFLGDVSQIDDPYLSARNNALTSLTAAFAGEALFGHVTLTKGERSAVADLAAERL